MPLANPELTEFTTVGQAVVSLSSLDLIQGIGFSRFFAVQMVGPAYELTTNNVFSLPDDGIITAGAGAAGDFDFDIQFKNPIRVEGECTIQVATVAYNGSGGAQAIDSTITVTLYHVDALAAETSLGTYNNQIISANLGAATGIFRSIVGKIDIAGTTFKKGEKLRLNVVNGAPGANNIIYFGVDPANRIGTALAGQFFDTTQSHVDLPVVNQ